MLSGWPARAAAAPVPRARRAFRGVPTDRPRWARGRGAGLPGPRRVARRPGGRAEGLAPIGAGAGDPGPARASCTSSTSAASSTIRTTGLRGLCMPYRPGLPLMRSSRSSGGTIRSSRPRTARALGSRGRVGCRGQSRPPRLPGWVGFPLSGKLRRGGGLDRRRAGPASWPTPTSGDDLPPRRQARQRAADARERPATARLQPRARPALGRPGRGGADAAGRSPTWPPSSSKRSSTPRWGRVGAGPRISYSLGLVTRELLTGRSRRDARPTLPLPRAIQAPARPPGRFPGLDPAHDPGVPAALEAIVARCLAYSPDPLPRRPGIGRRPRAVPRAGPCGTPSTRLSSNGSVTGPDAIGAHWGPPRSCLPR